VLPADEPLLPHDHFDIILSSGNTLRFNDPRRFGSLHYISGDPEQHPLLAYQIRNNVRLHRAKLFLVNSKEIKLKRQATGFLQIPEGSEEQFTSYLNGDDSAGAGLEGSSDPRSSAGEGARVTLTAFRDQLRGEQNLVIIFGSGLRGGAISSLIKFGGSIAGAKFICLGDYSNSRGAADMGLYPDLLPGYHAVADKGPFHREWGSVPESKGLALPEMVEAAKSGQLKAFYVVGANPIGRFSIDPHAFSKSFVVVQDMFLTETAFIADVVLPAANAYEKSGTVTNVCGEVQRLTQTIKVMGTKTDLEICGLIAKEMGLSPSTVSTYRRSAVVGASCLADSRMPVVSRVRSIGHVPFPVRNICSMP